VPWTDWGGDYGRGLLNERVDRDDVPDAIQLSWIGWQKTTAVKGVRWRGRLAPHSLLQKELVAGGGSFSALLCSVVR
jgi:hypothetical protein